MTVRRYSIILTVVVAGCLICSAGLPIRAASWQSSDGVVSIYFHDGWEKGSQESTKIYNTKGAEAIVSGSQHRLFLGGLLAKRYLNLQVAKYPANADHTIDELTNLIVERLRAQGLEIVQQFSDQRTKSWVLYRFLHSGDPVSQTIVFIRASKTLYLVEMTAPRKDEKRMQGEALQVFNSIKLKASH